MSSAGNISVQQHLEGLDLQGIGAGTSDAKSLTLSFWVRSTKTGVFNTILYQKDGGKFAVQNTTISSANTWEKKTFTVAGNTADAIANDNTKSMTIEFWLDAGTSYRGGTVSGSWNTWADNEAGEGITLNLGDSTSNDFYLTGVKLEIGTAATDYDYQSYSDELRRCQRYFHNSRNGEPFGVAGYKSGSEIIGVHWFPVSMRDAPSITGSSFEIRIDGGGRLTNGSGTLSGVRSGLNSYQYKLGGFSGLSSGDGAYTCAHNGGTVSFSAEL